MDLKKALKLNGFNDKQIEEFMNIYKIAEEKNIPYPYYYSLLVYKG